MNIKILHDADIQDIIEETKDECNDVKYGIYLQTIQHYDVQVAGWLMHMHDGVDLDFWQNFFDEELEKRKYPRGSIGLTLRKPLDGRFSRKKITRNHYTRDTRGNHRYERRDAEKRDKSDTQESDF